MTEHEMMRCPSCDTSNPGHATFCTHCGKPIGTGAAAAPSEMYASTVSAAEGAGVKGYMIGAIAVAAVLVVGGALFFLADGDERDGTTGVASSEPVADGPDDTGAVTSLPVTVPATVPVTEVPTPPAQTVAITTPAEVVPPTVATTAPPAPTNPPSTPPLPTAPPTPAPVPISTAPPVPGATLSFAQADDFYRRYIAAAISGDYNAAWNLLSSSDQADYTNGFDQFVGFWRRVSFADVQRVESVGGSAGFQSLAVNMAYGQADGGPTSFEVVEVDVNVRPDGSLQIFDYRYIRNQ